MECKESGVWDRFCVNECDHNVLMVECKNEAKKKVQKKKWRLGDVNWENFQVCSSERRWDSGKLSVDELNERLTENVRCAGFNRIGFVRISGRKRMNKPW